MGKTKKVVRTVLVVGVVGALAALATFSAFSSQTDNPGNSVTAGSVALSDNDGGSAAYNLTAAKPGQSSTPFCIHVAYTGLDADVKIYAAAAVSGALAPYVNLKLESGSQATPNSNCSGFAADQTLFNTTLDNFPSTYASGILDAGPGAATKWATGDAVDYRVTATLAASAPDSAQAQTTGTHTIRFEAHNQ